MKNLLLKRFSFIVSVFCAVILTSNAFAQTAVFTTAGTTSWTCPAGVTSVTVECWGGGGAGGGSTTLTRTGGGGGGGAYRITNTVTVIPGTTYSLTVGAGGTGSTGNGTAGSSSTCLGVTAAGGGLGTGASGSSNGNGGAGGTASQSGGTGRNGTNTSPGGGGGGAGDAGGGGNGGNPTAGTAGTAGGGAGGAGGAIAGAAGVAGSQPGGGGGGAHLKLTANLKGGDGGAGRVEITYAICAAPTAAPTALVLTPGANNIAGSFTASSPASSGYLVIRTDDTNAPTVAPTNGTAYSAGNTFGNATVVSFGTSLTFNATGLAGNEQYSFWVYGYNNTNCANGPAYRTGTLSGNACTNKTTPTAAATGLVLTPAATSIAGTFTAASPAATGYLVIRTNALATPTNAPVNGTIYTAGATLGNATIVSYSTGTTFNSTGLTINSQYSFWIYSFNATNCSTTPLYFGTSVSGNTCTTTSAPSATPSSLTLTSGGSIISGTFTSSGANGYLVIRTDNTAAPTVAPTNGTVYAAGNTFGNATVVSYSNLTSFTASGLGQNSQYTFWIYPFSTTVCSSSPVYGSTSLSGVACTSKTAPSSAPSGLTLTAAATAISGTFTATVPPASGYLVILTNNMATPSAAPVNNTVYAAGATLGNATVVSYGSTTSFNASGLAINSQYSFWIYSFNATNCSATPLYFGTALSGNSCTVTTAPTAAPTALALTPGTSSIGGTFTASSPVSSGCLVIRTDNTATPTVAPTNGTIYTAGNTFGNATVVSYGGGTSFNATGLAANSQFSFWIYGYNTTNCSSAPAYCATTLSGSGYTCTPPVQPTLLNLTIYPNVITGSFTASVPAATEYLVIRTATAAAPTPPVNGTTYTVGSAALGGYVESAGAATTFSSTGLASGVQYWYWVYGYNSTTCVTPYYEPTAPLSATATTAACGSMTNTATITTPGSATYNWSALAWSFGHLPTPCENALLVLNNPGLAADAINVRLDVNISVNNFDMQNVSPGAFVHIFNTSGSSVVNIAGNMTMISPGGNKFNRTVFGNQTSTTINGNLTLGRFPAGATDGHAAIGSTSSTAGQLYTIYGNMTFNPRGYTTDEWAKFVFNKAGTQYIYNNTVATDTVQPVLFEHLVIGSTNATTVIFGGTAFDGYVENVGRQGVEIGVNSTLDLPANYSLNLLPGGTKGFFRMLAGSRLRLGGSQSIAGSGGQAGSNFPNRHLYTFDPTSTIEYYGANSISQTVYSGVTYQNLELVNGSGSGRAVKINTGGVTASVSIKIKSGADWNMGSTITANGPFDVQSNGGLYCGTNFVLGSGNFSLNAGGYLGMGDPNGITAGTFASGNVQSTGTRTFSTGGNYIYNGTVAQITGSGLPGTCNDLTIDNPTTVTIGSDQLVTGINALKQGIFDIATTRIGITGAGTLTSVSGKMKANRGVVDMAGTSGTAQGLSGSWFVARNISTLINSNSTGITLAAGAGDTLLIGSALLYGPLTTNSLITTNDNLTLLSRDTATARFGEIVLGSGNNITGKVNVERYIGTSRKWRHLAWNTNSTQTAMQSWMENNTTPNANANPGYGTVVTDEKVTWSANNFDSRSVSGPSVKYYDPVTNTYTGIPNTMSYQMNTNSSYYNFVRGDRSCIPANSLISPTILRSTGTLKTGNQTFTIPATKFGSVGNPYASAIDIRGLDTVNLTSTFYVWDPKLSGIYGLGAYQILYQSGAGYKVMPGGGSYGPLNNTVDTLESGQAMFVRARASAGTLRFKESAKTMGLRVMARPGQHENIPSIYALLDLKDPASTTLVDGCMAQFEPGNTPSVDFDDALKMTNTGENVAFKREGQMLSLERRPDIISDDTMFLNLSVLRIHQYQWTITADHLDAPGRVGYFVDKYLNTSTQIDLNARTPIVFDIINVPGSWAPDRFMIVFKQRAVVLPVKFTSISAVRNSDKNATVKYNTENEINMQSYEIEYSADGSHFAKIGTQSPSANNGGSTAYTYVDGHATASVNYYRVKGISTNGHVDYTAIAKVGPLSEEPGISIYPNPVTGTTLNLRFENQVSGNYAISVTNKIGQLLHTETITIQNGNTVQMINFAREAAKGGYQVTVTGPDGKLQTIPFMVQ